MKDQITKAIMKEVAYMRHSNNIHSHTHEAYIAKSIGTLNINPLLQEHLVSTLVSILATLRIIDHEVSHT